jgi:hypothetical protein
LDIAKPFGFSRNFRRHKLIGIKAGNLVTCFGKRNKNTPAAAVNLKESFWRIPDER